MNVENPVKDIMTRSVVVVEVDAPLVAVEKILESKPIHHVVVLTDGVVVGIISKQDMLRIYKSVGLDTPDQMASLKAKDFMVSDPMVVDPDDTIGLVSDIFLANRFHSLPVVEDGELVGIVTGHDLIQYAYQ